EQVSQTESRWRAILPGDHGTVAWEAEIVKDVPGKLIGWRSKEGAIIENAGKVEFYDDVNSSGTLIRVVFSYHPVMGGLRSEERRVGKGWRSRWVTCSEESGARGSANRPEIRMR